MTSVAPVLLVLMFGGNMTKAERLQWWLDYPEAESATKWLPSADCSPRGAFVTSGCYGEVDDQYLAFSSTY